MKSKKLVPGATESQVLAGVLDAFAAFGVDAERRNTGGMRNASGQYVPFGRKGNSDIHGTFPAHFGAAAGKSFAVEVKKETFDHSKVRGKEWDRFRLQVFRLIKLNDSGGYGFWIKDVGAVSVILFRIREGWRILLDKEGNQWLVSPEDQA